MFWNAEEASQGSYKKAVKTFREPTVKRAAAKKVEFWVEAISKSGRANNSFPSRLRTDSYGVVWRNRRAVQFLKVEELTRMQSTALR